MNVIFQLIVLKYYTTSIKWKDFLFVYLVGHGRAASDQDKSKDQHGVHGGELVGLKNEVVLLNCFLGCFSRITFLCQTFNKFILLNFAFVKKLFEY